jgi:hypothetical protein
LAYHGYTHLRADVDALKEDLAESSTWPQVSVKHFEAGEELLKLSTVTQEKIKEELSAQRLPTRPDLIVDVNSLSPLEQQKVICCWSLCTFTLDSFYDTKPVQRWVVSLVREFFA